MLDRPRHQAPVRRTPQVPRLVHHSRRVLTRINRLTALPAPRDLSPDALHAGEILRSVIKRGHHHMPPLPPLRVIAVVAGDETPNGVVRRVHSGHRPTLSPPPGAAAAPWYGPTRVPPSWHGGRCRSARIVCRV